MCGRPIGRAASLLPMSQPVPAKTDAPPKPANFLRTLIERELQDGVYAQRRWAGSPGDAAHQAAGGMEDRKSVV